MYIDTLWEKIIEYLKGQIEPENLDLWIKEISPHSFENNIFKVQVPNKFFKEWFQNNSLNLIEKYLRDTTGNEIKVSTVISQKETPQNTNVSLKKVDAPVKMSSKNTPFTKKYTFDTFVVGKNNRFAQAACEAIAKDPGEAYNPLFIYGGVGLGKTHLMHAIGNYIKSENPTQKVLYITADKFMNELIESIRHDKNIEFRKKYRTLDVLLIDDIQFLAGKESTQEEFFHTFNTLYESRKQIVLSSDSSPKEIPTLEERLRSRFEWGVIADIQPPDFETRIAILRKKVEMEKISVPDDVLIFIASKIKKNIRELEGSLIRVAAFSLLTKSNITMENTIHILKDIIIKEIESDIVTIDSIQHITAKHFNIDKEDLIGKTRTEAIAFPRQISMYLSRTLTDASTTEIGRKFGRRDHSTVMYACDKIKDKIEKDPYFSALINKITNTIRSYE